MALIIEIPKGDEMFVSQEISYTARFSLHQVHGSQCTKEYYTKYS